jgi:D-glycero-alpha-D-manno-heptose 1-phosphate guanylyltransferase
VLILNGDTIFRMDPEKLFAASDTGTKAVVALKPMENFDRYGAVQLDENGYIKSFEEKKLVAKGMINGGVYLLNKPSANLKSFSEKFSFEKDFLEAEAGRQTLKGCICDDYFIDIGIPEDYKRAQKEL